MKNARCTPIRMPVFPAILFLACVSPAFCDDSQILVLSKAPLSLPRLAPDAAKIGKSPLRGDAFETVDLSKDVRARKDPRGIGYVAIAPETVWQRKLRNQRSGANYVSFTLNASNGTQVSVGGATFVVEPSEKDPGYAALLALGTDKMISHEMPWMLYGGARMAALDIVTIKIDRKASTWAMWFRDTLVAVDMPLGEKQGDILITAGKAGAWLCGLVCSDENPLFEDANDNAIPDDFESEILGRPLEQNASARVQETLRRAWHEERASRKPSEFVLIVPLPDAFPADCDPNGQIVHGMTGGLKFGAPKNN